MARKPDTIRTVHLLTIASSLEAQNEKIGMLLATCESVLTHLPGAEAADVRKVLGTALRWAVDDACAALYPED